MSNGRLKSSGLLPKMLRLSERFGATVTPIRSVVGVHPQMLAEVVLGCETLLAEVAVERPLTGVRSFVHLHLSTNRIHVANQTHQNQNLIQTVAIFAWLS